MRKTSINLAYWNINCLKSKLFDNSKDTVFLKEISCFDIVCLSEIKCNMDNVSFDGFRSQQHPISIEVFQYLNFKRAKDKNEFL